jgi:hypothetical protein
MTRDDEFELILGTLSDFQEFVMTAMAEGHHEVYEDKNEFLKMTLNAFIAKRQEA